jgi:hypothetical protein
LGRNVLDRRGPSGVCYIHERMAGDRIAQWLMSAYGANSPSTARRGTVIFDPKATFRSGLADLAVIGSYRSSHTGEE